MNAPTFETVDVRGTPVRLLRDGSGPVMIVLRGSDASDVWLPWMSRLARRFDVVVPEHPGFGGAAAPQWLERISDLANFYLDFADALSIERFHLLGTSLGGWIAADIAHRAAHRITSLTLVGAAGLRVPNAPGVDIFLRGETRTLHDRFHDHAQAEIAAQRLLAPEREDVRLAEAITVARLAWSPRLYDPHLMRWLHRIAAPTLVVWGEHDRIFPLPHAHAWAGAIPDARLEIVPACGHWVAMEQPDALIERVEAFTSSLEKAA